MSPFRNFSSSQGLTPATRTIDNEAPSEMRQELVDVIFTVCENNEAFLHSRRIYEISQQSSGAAVSGYPYGGYRYAVGRDLGRVDWNRVYDLIVRLVPEFQNAGLYDTYREGVNRVLAGHGIVWELAEDGRLNRILPSSAQIQIQEAIQELRNSRFSAAAQLFTDARNAYDDRPRRDNDACTNAFKAMESVAKVVFNMPAATFGNVLGHIRAGTHLTAEIVGMLDALNTLRNRKLGHGMPNPFDLSPSEVDFVYLSCVGGVLLFARRP